MGVLGGSLPICPRNQHCWRWARIYMKYCLCNVRDGASFSLGLVSVVSWGVAEVPQIITNYKEKSTEGISIAFLMTWVVGDFFNVFGCLLEPATLPTQFYMAILYTVTTLILTAQTIYYGHMYHRLKANKMFLPPTDSKLFQDKKTVKAEQAESVEKKLEAHKKQQAGSPSSPIPVAAAVLPRYGSFGRDLYYMSARSLAKSRTPTVGSYLAHSRGSGRTPTTSILNRGSIEEPLLGGLVSAQSAPHLNKKSMLCAVFVIMFFLRSFNLQTTTNSQNDAFLTIPPRGFVIQVGRKVLQSMGETTRQGDSGSIIGTILGWAMAAIYMGGRLPQICLNIKRGTVEGLNPFMFVFALVGNSTYVLSIIVRSTEWSKIRPNLPWLVDAGACVFLDSCILIQFIYFHYRKPKASKDRNANFV